jgi:hypothetical protein
MVLGNASLAAGGAAGRAPYPLSQITILSGPFNHVPAFARTVALDLGNSSAPVVQTRGDAGSLLVLFKLVLTGLAAAPVAPGVVSALPLWAVGRPGGTGGGPVQVRLDRVALVLPASDYAALLAAALRGPAWHSGAHESAALLAGITQLVPAANGSQPGGQLTPASPSLLLAAYSGWGVNATSLRLVPDVPLASCEQLPDWRCAAGDEQGDGGSDQRAVVIGVGVGVGVGVPLLVAAVAAVAAVAWHMLSKRQQATE